MGAASVCAHGGEADRPLTALPHSPSLDLASMDTTVDPCVDFYRYSCGGWQRNNPIPPDEASWNVYTKLHEDNLRLLWGLLIEAATPRPERTTAQQKSGDYFAACMDEASIDAAGARPLHPTLDRVSALSSAKGIAALLASLHRAGQGDAMFRFRPEQDFVDASRVIAGIDAGGLGLPDREHYLATDPRSKAIRAGYLAYIERMLRLLGDAESEARAAAQAVLAIETALARGSLAREAQRDPRGMYHPMAPARLRRLASAFDWSAYLHAMGVPADTPINVAQPRFLRTLDALLRGRPLAQWKSYLRWNVVNSQAPYLAQPIARASFDFYATQLRGVQEMPARWKQCVRWVDRDLGEALGQVFVQRAFAPETRERAAAMARAIQEAMRSRIATLAWMRPSTKQAALAKLDTLVLKIGYPDRWRDYGALEVRRGDFFGNVARSQAFEAQRQLAKLGRPVDRSEWDMTPPTVNAYYDAQLNAMNFPAGILQPPLFDAQMDDAPNYGNTGSTIGHELTHGFDDEGRHFDARGNLRDWWGAQDAAQFDQRAACIVDQYSRYTVIDDIRINGRLTVGEDVADLGGTLLAYMAWKAVASHLPAGGRDGFTPDQRFFIGMAQWACSNERPQILRLRALTDSHSPNRWRVIGVVSNMPEFARAFSCRPGQPMVRAKRCRIW